MQVSLVKASLLALWPAVMPAVAAVLGGCSADPLPTDSHNPSPPQPAPAPTPTPPAPTAKPLDGAHLARRLALDLTLSLPAAQDVALLTSDAAQFPALVDTYIAGGAAGRALGGLHPRMWHLDSRKLADLDAFVAGGNTTLATSLTPAARLEIVQEPALYVRHVIEHHLPFADVYAGGFALTHASLVSLWNLNDDGEAFIGEPYRFATYKDGRPAAGILDTPGMMAAFAGRSDPALRQRTADLLREVLCLNLESPLAHTFTDLTAAELQTDLAQLALTRPPCAGCHGIVDQAAAAWAGLGSGANFAAWLAYTTPTAAVTGDSSGQSYTGLGGLATTIAADQRSQRCELQKLGQAIYQRPLATAADTQSLAQAVDELKATNLDLASAARYLFLSPDYAYAVISPDLKGPVLRQSSGVRVLGLAQWQGVLQSLVPTTTGLDFSDDLDPGHDATYGSDRGIPVGAYWHRVDRLAREAASAIVAAELADGVPAATRRLLTDLPDGAGNTASAATITQQLKDLWLTLTAVQLGSSDQKLADLQTLWATAQPGTDASDFRRAWRTVLVAVFTDPTFLTY